MKRKLSLKVRLMMTTSILLIVVCISLTICSILNAYFNMIKPFQELFLEQQLQLYGPEAVTFMDTSEQVVINANDFFLTSIVLMMVTILVGCIFTYWVSKYSLRPLKIWSKEMERMNQNELNLIQTPKTNDELDVLANSFNQLMERLKEAFARERRFSASAAHELKTPLTVIRTNIEVLQMDDMPSNEEYAETIEVCKKQNERMIQLVDDLLLMNASQQKLHDCIDFDALFAEIEQELSVEFDQKQVHFSYEKKGYKIQGNINLMKQAFTNLVQNAIKYNVQNGEIIVTQKKIDAMYHISVYDTGIGISQRDVPYIFEPFYRADPSRNRLIGGAGLGLAITKEIIEQHQGTIQYDKNIPQGSIFMICLPCTALNEQIDV